MISIGKKIQDYINKALPIGNDKLLIVDSEDNNSSKNINIGDIKTSTLNNDAGFSDYSSSDFNTDFGNKTTNDLPEGTSKFTTQDRNDKVDSIDVTNGTKIGQVGTKIVDETNLADGALYQYNNTSGKVELANYTLNQYAVIQDQKPKGTNGGDSQSTYTTRDLNTIVYNNISGLSLSSNQITLSAGTYKVKFTTSFYYSTGKSILYNITDATTLIHSISGYQSGDTSNFRTLGEGIFTINDTKVIAIQSKVTATRANGWGYNTNLDTEVYSTIEIQKL